MQPSARLQAAIDILDGLDGTAQPADRFMKDWFRTRRFAGSGDRRDIGELVYRVLRHRFSLAHRMGARSPRALVIAALVADGKDPATLFTGGSKVNGARVSPLNLPSSPSLNHSGAPTNLTS